MDLRQALRSFTARDDTLAALSLYGNLAAYVGLLALGLAAAKHGRWLIAAPAVLGLALAKVRLYVLQHDLGHLSLFESRRRNEIWGHLISPLTMAGFRAMQFNHNLHHATVGNLDERDKGEIFTMTLAEWRRAGVWRRLFYRLYRCPAILLPVGAAWTYFLRYRWPRNARRAGLGGVVLHNLSLAAYGALLWGIGGWVAVGLVASAVFLGGCLGVALVYLQHNFDGTWWDRKPGLDNDTAAIRGSSCLDFGWIFDEAVANITKHDIHHLNAAIPSYRLRQAHRAVEAQFPLRRIGPREALAAFRLKLWDEAAGRLVPFPKDAVG